MLLPRVEPPGNHMRSLLTVVIIMQWSEGECIALHGEERGTGMEAELRKLSWLSV